jgi:diaminopimelate decarboxylase
LARAAGFEEIVVNGLGRSSEFLRRVASDGCPIVLDSLQELERLQSCFSGATRLGLRVKLESPGPYGGPGKLGLSGDQLEEALQRCRPQFLHLHLASQERSAEPYCRALRQLRELPLPPIQAVDLGGGFESLEDPAHLFTAIADCFQELFPDSQLWIEPGRYLVNRAGFVVTQVVTVKESEGRIYAVVDAGTNTLMPHREATYRCLYPPPGEVSVCLVDGITSLSSVILPEVRLPNRPQPGDRILLGNCGAYTAAMSQFWAFLPLPVAFLNLQGEIQEDLTLERLEECRRLLLG